MSQTHFPRSGDVIHPQLSGIWVWIRDYLPCGSSKTVATMPGSTLEPKWAASISSEDDVWIISLEVTHK